MQSANMIEVHYVFEDETAARLHFVPKNQSGLQRCGTAVRPNPQPVLLRFKQWRSVFRGRTQVSTRPTEQLQIQCSHAQKYLRMVYNDSMRTNIDINESLVRKARKLTRLKTKRQIVDKALELLVRSESRKGILRYYGSGIWKGDPKAMRRNRV
jgi:Arc/MetJ family transcription regulator